ncbi:MAG: M48 family metallopeptidase [Bacilli bacterium]|nr:M48 family metallopeptidase [Bacilli bacterium]
MIINFNDNDITVNIIRKNNKNVYFRFKDANTLEITCHYLVTDHEIKSLIKKNEKSLIKLYQKTVNKIKKHEVFTILGTPYTIIIDESLKNVEMDIDYIKTPSMDKLNKYTKALCKDVFQTEINKYSNIIPGIPKFSLKIRKMTTRWGVCNPKLKTITLNSDLIYYKRTLIDYVIVHEMCHFFEANHSKKFWEHVSKYYPNYKEARKELRN